MDLPQLIAQRQTAKPGSKKYDLSCGCIYRVIFARQHFIFRSHMNYFSPQEALHQPRQLAIRLRIEKPLAVLAEEDIRLLLAVLAHHGVLCISSKPPVGPGQLRDFAAHWGEIIELPASLALSNQEPGLPSITRIGNIRSDGSIIPSVRFGEYWHHDGDFWPPGENFVVNFISSAKIPRTGGHTGFLDTRMGYEMLDNAQKAELTGATIRVSASGISDFKNAPAHELPPDVVHPVLLPHPLTGQISMYLPEGPDGIRNKEGEALDSQRLINSIIEKTGVFVHAWSPGDLLIIDNLQVMHRSMGGYGNIPRLLYRCQARIFKSRATERSAGP
jgi:taurine dioxygenase